MMPRSRRGRVGGRNERRPASSDLRGEQDLGILYLGIDINLPSVLWMRRMLDGLADEVAVLAAEVAPREALQRRFPTVVLEDSWLESKAWGLLFRCRCIDRLPATRRALTSLRRAVERPEVDQVLVHYANLAAKYGAVWRHTDKPVWVHCHGYDVTWDLRQAEPPHGREHDRHYVQRVLALPSSVRFIANSKSTAQRLRDIGIDTQRIDVKYLGVPMSDQPPPPHRPVETVEILYLGRLIDCKGPDLVIQAFDRAVELGLKGRLVMAGDGPLRQRCEELRRASPNREHIELLGSVDGATGEALRQRAQVFTAHNQLGPASRQEEAFGVSLVEAMAAGLPVVSGRNGSLPELIDDGQQGFLVAPGDIEAHARAFVRLAADPDLRTRLGLSGWQRSRQRFSLDGEIEALRRLLHLPDRSLPDRSLPGSTTTSVQESS